MSQYDIYTVMKKHRKWLTNEDIKKLMNHSVSMGSITTATKKMCRHGVIVKKEGYRTKCLPRTKERSGKWKVNLYKIK